MADIATNWKVLSGENDWEGLLDPIDDNLRRYLVHYGALAGVAGDSLNEVKVSDGYGLCRYPPEEIFTRVGLQSGNAFKYLVTDYFYARAELDIFAEYVPAVSSFIGYVAVSSDEGKLVLGRRDIVVSWRGTTFPVEWIEDLIFVQVPATDMFPNSEASVHKGFYDIYTSKNSTSAYTKMSAREQVLAAVRRLVDKFYEEDPSEVVSITVVGHSLGAALATLNATDIVANGYNNPTGSTLEYPVACFAFASPRVGDSGFLNVFSGLKNFHLLRVRNANDIVPDLPPLEILDITYTDVGVELKIDASVSPALKKVEPHNLNLYRYGISGYQGKDKTFKLAVNFDVALVNKYGDMLLETYKVPPNWWSNVINYGMVQIDDGSWKLHDYVPDPPAGDASGENGTA